jgi:hypothetical protein
MEDEKLHPGPQNPAAIPQRSGDVRFQEDDLLQLPSEKAAQNKYASGSIVLFSDPLTAFVCLETVEKIFIDLTTREFVFRLVSNNDGSNSVSKKNGPVYALESELQLGPSCPVWARPVHFTDDKDDLAAIVLGSYDNGNGVLYSVKADDSERVKYHGVPSSSVRYRSSSESSVSKLGHDRKSAEMASPAGADAQSLSDPEETSKFSDKVPAVEKVVPLHKREAPEESHDASPASSSKRTKVDVVAPSPVVDHASQSSFPSTPTGFHPPSQVQYAKKEQSYSSLADNPVSDISQARKEWYIPKIVDPLIIKEIFIGAGGCLHKKMEHKYRCKIKFSGFPFAPQTEPLKAIVTGLGSDVNGCIERMEHLLVESTPAVDRGRLLFHIAKVNGHGESEGKAIYQKSPLNPSTRIWMYAIDLPPRSREWTGLFIGKNGSLVKDIERRTNCTVAIENGCIRYVLVTARDSRSCNKCVEIVTSKLAWCEDKFLSTRGGRH